jgi:hypothetical protein
METKRIVVISPVEGDVAKIKQRVGQQRIHDVAVEHGVLELEHIYTEDPDTLADRLYQCVTASGGAEVVGFILSMERDDILSTARALEKQFKQAGRPIEKPLVLTETSNPDQLTFNLGMAVAHCVVGMLPGIFVAANGLRPWNKCKLEDDTFVSTP